MTRNLTFFASCLLLLTNVFAQANSDVLLTVAGEQVTKEEFIRVYSKNNKQPSFDRESLDEYMNLFINFKLKVKEAEALGLDTSQTFTKEFEGYKLQLEKPYFKDESIVDAMALEAYERLKWELKASHILINVKEGAMPADTLAAYKRISDIRAKALKGDDFGELAKQYSEDPSAQYNLGDLGFFSAFRMVMPFEDAAYNTKVGNISPIIRTRFGYHILKVYDKRPTVGQVKVAHIMKKVNKNSSAEEHEVAKQAAFQIYDSIMQGVSFAEMALKHSDDKGSAMKGGELPMFGSGRMVPEFEEAAFALDSIGAVSEPILSNYGWHIIKLLDTQEFGSFDEEKEKIYTNVRRIIPSNKTEQIVIDRIKNEYGYKEYKENATKLITIVDTLKVLKNQDYEPNFSNNEKVLVIGDSTYYQTSFLKYISMNRIKNSSNFLFSDFIEMYYNNFTLEMVKEYERAQLPLKHPEYKHLLKEYHDGILLFNLTDSMVWSRAVKDSAGLNNFYENNKQNYMWGNRVKATLYVYNNANMESKVLSMAKKVAKKDSDPNAACIALQAKTQNSDSSFNITCKQKKYMKGDNANVDDVVWTSGSYKVQQTGDKYILTYIHNPIEPEPKQLSEAKGLITADYQAELEKEWLAALREKYEFSINEQVFNSIVE